MRGGRGRRRRTRRRTRRSRRRRRRRKTRRQKKIRSFSPRDWRLWLLWRRVTLGILVFLDWETRTGSRFERLEPTKASSKFGEEEIKACELKFTLATFLADPSQRLRSLRIPAGRGNRVYKFTEISFRGARRCANLWKCFILWICMTKHAFLE